MADPNDWIGIAGIVGVVIFCTASWLLHKRLRNRQSLCFLWSMVAFAVWLPTSSLTTFLVLSYSDPGKSSKAANFLVLSSEVLVTSLLILLVASTFWLAVRSIPQQPN